MNKKVLIVEDDKFFRFAVKKYVDWEKYGFEIIGEAVHGKAAMEFVETNAVEVVVTDMSMPVMNGVELTKELKIRYPDIMVIALSAYDDFEFVKESLKAGASDYILKQDIETGEFGLGVYQAWKKHLRDLSAKIGLKDSVVRYLQGSNEGMNVQAEKYLELCMEKGYGMYLFVVKNLNHDWTGQHCQKSYWTKDSLIELHDRKEHLVFVPVQQNLSFMAQFEIRNTVLKCISDILEKEDYLAGCSGIALQAEQLQKCFRQAQEALELGFFLENKKVLVWDSVSDLERQREFLESEETYRDIFTLEDALDALNLLTERIRTAMPDMEYVQKNYLIFFGIIAEHMQYNMEKIEFAEIKDKLKEAVLLDEQEAIIAVHLKEIFQNYIGTEDMHPGVLHCIQYMRQNYSQNLTLSDIAQHVSMNESYLSNLFKKEMGKGIAKYLNEIRIEKAKELILQTNDKIYEVGEQVGFGNASYFSTIFKRETGLTVHEYRKQNLYKKR